MFSAEFGSMSSRFAKDSAEVGRFREDGLKPRASFLFLDPGEYEDWRIILLSHLAMDHVRYMYLTGNIRERRRTLTEPAGLNQIVTEDTSDDILLCS